MPNQRDLDRVYMQCAIEHSKLSKAVRTKVGAVLVLSTGVIVPGYNGTPSGTDNDCETRTYKMVDGIGHCDAVTKPEVLHAELNCLMKCSKQGLNSTGSILYVTLSPCIACAAMLIQAGVSEVVYLDSYRDTAGRDYLAKYLPDYGSIRQIKI